MRVAIFSLFIFNFGLQKYFDDQISKAVNNSNDVAKNYLDENTKNVESDVIMMSVGLNRASNLFYTNTTQFIRVINAEKILRRIDDVYLIDSAGNILISDTSVSTSNFNIPAEEIFDEALKGSPVIIPGNIDNKTSVMIKLILILIISLYLKKYNPEILKYLNETERAVSFTILLKIIKLG